MFDEDIFSEKLDSGEECGSTDGMVCASKYSSINIKEIALEFNAFFQHLYMKRERRANTDELGCNILNLFDIATCFYNIDCVKQQVDIREIKALKELLLIFFWKHLSK